ncbi:acyltransferase family protein [Lacticaseibacillus sp. GG6-2]
MKKSRRIKWFSLVRITGLILVLTYHFFQTSFPGGFIGVDVFFTFSGFLITSLMIDEANRTRDFHLLAFYRRRFYRIVPPLVLAVLVVTPLTMLVRPDFVADLGHQIMAALGFVTNYFEIATGGSYETKFTPHLFVHTWSLAVEMHFYLLWGLLSWILARVTLWHGGDDYRRAQHYRMTLGVLALLLAIASYGTMIIRANGLHEFSPVYFSSVTHSFPFYFGAFAGAISGITNLTQPMQWLSRRSHAWQPALMMILSAGTLVILGFRLRFDHLVTYTLGMFVAVVISCVMIISARLLHDQTQGIDEPRVVTFLADTSYSLYLYHWPLYVIFSQRMNNLSAVVLTVILGLIFSTLSYYVIEPLVAGKPLTQTVQGFQRWQFKGLALVATLVLSVVCGWRVSQAPSMTQLESDLWIGDLYQDRDQTEGNVTTMLAAQKPKPAVRTLVSVAAKRNDDYRAKNMNSTASKNGIPSGTSIIGDSVTLGTRRYLQPHVAESNVDAQGDRTMDLAYKIIMQQQRTHQLREFVVICIGTNALDDYAKQLHQILTDLQPGHKVVLMTPYNAKAAPDWNSSKLAVLERKLPAKYQWITIADWESVASRHPAVFAGTDGVHFAGRAEGDKLYADTINAALVTAAKKPAKS